MQGSHGVARRERYIGEGVFGAWERVTQRLSYASFFGYFLVWYKKVTLPDKNIPGNTGDERQCFILKDRVLFG